MADHRVGWYAVRDAVVAIYATTREPVARGQIWNYFLINRDWDHTKLTRCIAGALRIGLVREVEPNTGTPLLPVSAAAQPPLLSVPLLYYSPDRRLNIDEPTEDKAWIDPAVVPTPTRGNPIVIVISNIDPDDESLGMRVGDRLIVLPWLPETPPARSSRARRQDSHAARNGRLVLAYAQGRLHLRQYVRTDDGARLRGSSAQAVDDIAVDDEVTIVAVVHASIYVNDASRNDHVRRFGR